MVNAMVQEESNPPIYPVFWDLCEIDDSIKAPMHITMGVLKAVSNLIHDWAHGIGQED